MNKNRNKRKNSFWILMSGLAILTALCIAGLIWMQTGDIQRIEQTQAQIKENKLEETEENLVNRPEITILTEDSLKPETEFSKKPESEDARHQTAELVFAGDVLLSDHVLQAYEKGGGIRGVVGPEFLEKILSADIFMVNEEFPFSSRGTQAEDKQYTFRLPPEKVSIFQEMGIDIVTLANNHALDFGTDALLDTCRTLDEAGILRVGAGTLEEAKSWQTIEAGGKKIGFLGATRVIPVADWAATVYSPGMFATYDPTELLEKIKEARAVHDYVVVYVHWGAEREEFPKDYQKTLGHQYIDAGADLVIGSHPHVLQGIEYYKGKPIVYSLGNFVFGSSIPRTMLLEVQLDGEEPVLKVIPGTSSAGYTRELTKEEEKQEFYRYLEGISSVAIDENGVVVPNSESDGS